MADAPAPAPQSEPTFLDDMKKHLGVIEEEEHIRKRAWDLVVGGKVKEIQNEEEANLIAAEFVRAEEEIERVMIQAENRISRAKRRYAAVEFVFKTALDRWAAKQLEGKKKKSITLEDASVGFRSQKATVRTVNDQALKEWAEETYVESISYVPRVSLTMVSDWEAKHKKLAPGREAVEATEKFYVKRLKKGGE